MTEVIGSKPGRAYSTAVTVNYPSSRKEIQRCSAEEESVQHQVTEQLIFISGQVAYDKEAAGGGIIHGGFEEEARESLKNLEDILV